MTVTTVGYGDYTPVTAPGRVTACFVMGIGLLTLAVVTAQVASSFVTQGTGKAQPGPQGRAGPRGYAGRTRPAARPDRRAPRRRHRIVITATGRGT